MVKRCVHPSTTAARTQPLVLSPPTMIVSIPRAVSWPNSGVPEKMLGDAFAITSSPGSGATSSMMSFMRPRRAAMSGLSFAVAVLRRDRVQPIIGVRCMSISVEKKTGMPAPRAAANSRWICGTASHAASPHELGHSCIASGNATGVSPKTAR
jgi:hypothetical protein